MKKRNTTGRNGKRRKVRLPNALSSHELELILNTPSRLSVLGLRARCVLALMGKCGLRVSEVCNLTTKDLRLDADDPYVRVIGKGDKERRAFLGRSMIALLEHWMEIRPKRTAPLFPVIQNKKSKWGKSKPGRAISRYSVYEMTRYFAKKAGIRRNVHPHMLRHTYATLALRSNEDIRKIQIALGHASLATTQIYTHIENPEMAAMARRLDG